MGNAGVSTSTGLDGSKEVHARFDLTDVEIRAAAHAVNVSRTEQFRHDDLSTDDVMAMRELTALADELTSVAGHAGAVSVDLWPARIVALLDTLYAVVSERDEQDFTREEDREAYSVARQLSAPLADLAADALRAALDAAEHAGC